MYAMHLIFTSGEQGLSGRKLLHAELLAGLHRGGEVLVLDAGQNLLDSGSGLGSNLLLLLLLLLLGTLALLLCLKKGRPAVRGRNQQCSGILHKEPKLFITAHALMERVSCV